MIMVFASAVQRRRNEIVPVWVDSSSFVVEESYAAGLKTTYAPEFRRQLTVLRSWHARSNRRHGRSETRLDDRLQMWFCGNRGKSVGGGVYQA
jgi:hypothetical protein